MVTRSRKGLWPEKTLAPETKCPKKPVRLTEDILYIVNKKLKSIDKNKETAGLKSYLGKSMMNLSQRSLIEVKDLCLRHSWLSCTRLISV